MKTIQNIIERLPKAELRQIFWNALSSRISKKLNSPIACKPVSSLGLGLIDRWTNGLLGLNRSAKSRFATVQPISPLAAISSPSISPLASLLPSPLFGYRANQLLSYLAILLFSYLAIGLLPAFSAPPAWWTTQNVLDTTKTANDYAAVNQGQLKAIAKKAITEMNTKLPGGAGTDLNALLTTWSQANATRNDYTAVNLGQVKALAKKFYDRLNAVGVTTPYPWTSATTDDKDYAAANIGQVKKAFSFAILSPLPAAPTGLSASAGNAQVTLSWFPVTGATGYRVQRSTTSSSGYADFPGNTLNIPAGSVTTPEIMLTNTGLTNGTTYYYVVQATKGAGYSANSNQASATPGDTDGDNLSDAWEIQYFGNLSQGAEDNFDGDGLTNLQEYQNGTDPLDYYNGAPHQLIVQGGDWQIGEIGKFLLKPFQVKVLNGSGNPMVRAPVNFERLLGDGLLFATKTSLGNATKIVVLTDDQGVATIYYKQGSTENMVSQIKASTPTKELSLSAASLINYKRIIAAGKRNTIFYRSDGTLWFWGYGGNSGINWGGDDISSQVGDGSKDSKLTPFYLSNIPSTVRNLASGSYFKLLTMDDGSTWGWGSNYYGQTGNQYEVTARPIGNILDKKIAYLSGGKDFSLFLDTDGLVWSTGHNDQGQLGANLLNNDYTNSTPFQAYGLDATVMISAGLNHALALQSDGTVWSWGSNTNGELGIGNTLQKSIPQKIPTLEGIIGIAAGTNFSIAIKKDGSVWGWGKNDIGQLGIGSVGDLLTPTKLNGLSNIKQIVCGKSHVLALDQIGNVYVWGENGYGQLGNGSVNNSSTPTLLSTISAVQEICAGDQYSLAYKTDGTLWSWGLNEFGQLGTGGSGNYLLNPTKVSGLEIDSDGNGFNDLWEKKYFGSIGAVNATIDSDGDGATNLQEYLAQTDPIDFYNGSKSEIKILSGNFQFLTAGVVSAEPMVAEIRVNGVLMVNAPCQIKLLTGNTLISNAANGIFAKELNLRSDGTGKTSFYLKSSDSLEQISQIGIFAGKGSVVGFASVGSLGDETAINLFPLPGQYKTKQKVTLACMAAGTIRYTVDGSDPTSSSPSVNSGETVLVTKSSRLQARLFKSDGSKGSLKVGDYLLTGTISAGRTATLALKSDGTVWAWGKNESSYSTNGVRAKGLLGDILQEDTTEPIKLPLENIVGVEMGQTFGIAWDEDGSLYHWGGNFGLINDTNEVSSNITKISKISGVKKAAIIKPSDIYVLKEDGSVWFWGINNLNVPTKIDGFTDAVDIFSGSHLFVTKKDGSVWGSGNNYSGQLGLGDTASRTALTKVTGISNVSTIVSTEYSTLFLTERGDLYGCGSNGYGELGLGDTVQRLTPTLNPNINQVTRISGDSKILALDRKGIVYAWGDNQSKWITSILDDKCKVPFLLSEVGLAVDVFMGEAGFILKGDGSITSCGSPTYRGDGVNVKIKTPTKMSHFGKVDSLYAGNGQTILKRMDGTFWAYGDNMRGLLYDGTTVNRMQLVSSRFPTDTKKIIFPTSDWPSLLFIKNNGDLYQIGQEGSSLNGGYIILDPVLRMNNVVDVSCSLYSYSREAIYIKTDGVYSEGNNSGNGSINRPSGPTKIIAYDSDLEISRGAHCGGYEKYVLNSLGQILWWGYPFDGQNFSRSAVLSPVLFSDRENFSSIYGVYMNFGYYGLKSDGSLYVWGGSTKSGILLSEPVLGLGVGITYSPLPIKIPTLKDIISVKAGVSAQNKMALDANGSVYVWGQHMGDIGSSLNSVPSNDYNYKFYTPNPQKLDIPEKIIKIEKSPTMYFAITENHDVYAWGTDLRFAFGLAKEGFVKVKDLNLFDGESDSDSDGIPDSWEIENGTSPFWAGDANLDADKDGLTNLQEFLATTNPNIVDTDGDGIKDSFEVDVGLNPNFNDANLDLDGDGVLNKDDADLLNPSIGLFQLNVTRPQEGEVVL